jgi:hypothetical protein
MTFAFVTWSCDIGMTKAVTTIFVELKNFTGTLL